MILKRVKDIPFIFESIIIGNCIYTWNGFISILPIILLFTSIISIYKNDIKNRKEEMNEDISNKAWSN